MSKQNYEYSTADERLTRHRERVGDNADTSVEYMSEDALLDALNTLKRQIINAPFSGMEIDSSRAISVPGNGKGWDFMEDDDQFAFVAKTSLDADLAEDSVGNATIGSNTNMADEDGAFILYDRYGTWDFVTHESKSGSTTVTTVGNVDIDHDSGEIIEHLYKLPEDFARAKVLIVDEDEMYEGKQNPDYDFFCVYNGFLWMPRDFGISTGVLTYFKKPTDITDVDSTMDIPKELNPVLDNLLDARAFVLAGEDETLIRRAFFAAADALRAAMGYTTSSSNNRIQLARPMPRSPMQSRGGIRTSRFDEGDGY